MAATRCEKSESPEIYAKNRDGRAVEPPRSAKECSISAKRDERIDGGRISELASGARDFVQLILELEIESELWTERCNGAEDLGKILVAFVTDDAYAHQPARSCALRAAGW